MKILTRLRKWWRRLLRRLLRHEVRIGSRAISIHFDEPRAVSAGKGWRGIPKGPA